MSSLWRQSACAVSTVGPVGYVRPAPGTWGSVVAAVAVLAVGVWVPAAWAQWLMVLAAVAVTFVSLACIPAAIQRFDRKDPSQVVIDEVAGVWLAAALIPGDILTAEPLWTAILVCVLFRIIDISKPWPLPWLERLGGSPGVLCDDLMAGVAAGIATLVIVA